jgi:hypothetical protein
MSTAAQATQVGVQLRTVRVKVVHTPNSLLIDVRPWRVTLQQGDTVEWRLQGNCGNLEISPKSGPQWPFDGPPHGGNPAKSGPMKPGTIPGRRRYSIIVDCDGQQVEIDPDLDVDD